MISAPTLAAQRTVRFAAGSAFALAVSQALAWEHSYLGAVFAATFLSLPLPAPKLRGGLVFMLVLAASLTLGLLVVVPLDYQAAAGVLLLGMLFFGVFFYGLRGGNPIVGSLFIAGIAAVPLVGVLSVPAALSVCVSLLKAGLLALLVLWLAHAVFPDRPAPAGAGPAGAGAPEPAGAARLASRSTLVVMPVISWLLASGGTAYIGMAIKVASMGQQASADATRQAAGSLLASTCIGGLAATLLWMLLRIWPSLLLYVLLALLAGLVMGRRIFAGMAFAPNGQVWSYAYVTMLIVLGPAVLDSGDAAGGRFFDRIVMFLVATVYSVVAVRVFDGLVRPARDPHGSSTLEPGLR